MKSVLMLLIVLMASCYSIEEESKPKSNCFKLETCKAYMGTGGNSITLPCLVGFTDGKRTEEVYRFLSRDTLEIWSLLNPTVIECKQ